MPTMHEMYGDGSDCQGCTECGLCITCKDCKCHTLEEPDPVSIDQVCVLSEN